MLGALKAELGQVESGEPVFPLPEDTRREGQMQLVDQTGLWVLLNRRNDDAEAHVRVCFPLIHLAAGRRRMLQKANRS